MGPLPVAYSLVIFYSVLFRDDGLFVEDIYESRLIPGPETPRPSGPRMCR